MIDKLMDLKSHGYHLEDADIMKFKIFEQLFCGIKHTTSLV